nr:histone deacetylase 14 [Tanacetum cinerariifolium]
MADLNAPSGQTPIMAPPLRVDDQILPHIRWVPIGKNNCYLDLEKSHSNPIYKIAVDLLKNTNFFRAFTASSIIPSIYIQLFWDTILYDKKARCYRRQLDEQWFVLTKETLWEALHITSVSNNQAFVASPSIDGLIDFVNQLGYPKPLDLKDQGLLCCKFYGALSQEPILIMLRGSGRNLPNPYILLLKINGIFRHTSGKKRATLIVIPSIRFTKLIIHHLQRRHRFHPRPESPLHLPNEEPVVGYLKFSAKGTKREVLGMPILGSLITAEIQQASYYREYLAKVAQHRRYLASETGGVQDPPTPKPTQPARKPKTTAPKAPSRPSILIPATETSDKPPKEKKSKHGWVSKKRSQKNVEASKTEEVLTVEPQAADEDADYQKVLEESMKDTYALPRGTLPPVVIREPESGKYQPLPEVPGKGKAKVTEEQAGPDPGDAEAKVQSIPSPVVHAGSDRFTATAYPKVQENLKLAVEEQVLLEEPASSSGTLSSLQHLIRDFSFGDQFFSEKSSNVDKNAKTKVESMVNVMIQQALSSISLMTSPIIDLTSRPESSKEHQQLKATITNTTTTITFPPPLAPQQSTTEAMMVKHIGELEHIMDDLIQVNKDLEERLDSHGSRLYTLEQLDIAQQVSIAVSEVVTDAVDWAMQAPLHNRFRDLPEADMKEILHQRMWESESYNSHEDHMHLFEALEKSINRDHFEELAHDLAEARKKKKKSRESTKTPPRSPSHQPPPPPPPAGSATPSPSKTAASAEYQAWTTTDIRLGPSISLTSADLEMDEDMAPDEQAQSSNDEDIGSVHIPTVNLRQGWWKPSEEERPATPEPAWSIRSSDVPVLTNNWASALRLTIHPLLKTRCSHRPVTLPHLWTGFARDEELLSLNLMTWKDLLMKSLKSFIRIKPLPPGGPPGQVTIQSDFFFNKDLEYLRYGSKGRRPALSISKMKATYYPNVGLEKIVPDQFWIEEDVVRIEVFSMYGYNYMKKIVLSHADLNEYVITERDFKYLYPSDFEDLYLLNLQEDFQLGIESYQTQLNLTKPHWDATGYEYKHDYTVIDSPRAAIFWDKYGVQMMMRVNEIHKFSDGTLQQIDEALDYRIK